MIRPEDIKELEGVFADLNQTVEADQGQNASGSLPVVSEGEGLTVDPVVEVLAEILSELQSLNEFIRQ